MQEVYFGDWGKSFLNIDSKLIEPTNIEVSKIYSDRSFSIHENEQTFGVFKKSYLESKMYQVNEILFLINSSIVGDKPFLQNELTVNYIDFLERDNNELEKFEKYLTKDLVGEFEERIKLVFEGTIYESFFKKLFETEGQNGYLIYMYFLMHIVDLSKVLNYMNKNNLEEIELKTKTFTCSLMSMQHGIVIIEVASKGSLKNQLYLMNSDLMNVFEVKAFRSAFNKFVMKESLTGNLILIDNHSKFVFNSYKAHLDMLANVGFFISGKALLFLAKYAHYRLIKRGS